jgi:DNA polymerase-3 subunit delta'
MASRKPASPRTTRAPRVTKDDAAEASLGSGGDTRIRELAKTSLDGTLMGHAHARGLLGASLASGHLHHAWIFHGPPGIGKCTTALRLAALHVDPETTPDDARQFSPRRDSRSAELLRAGTHPDVGLIRPDLASSSSDRTVRERKQTNIPVGLLREHLIGGTDSEGRVLEARAYRSSFLGRGKAFIIDEAEMLEADGQNVLLKTLEEPPPGTLIILVTPSADRLLPTIRSRCQRIGFTPLSDPEMAQWADASLPVADPAERAWIAAFAEGSPGLAQVAASHSLRAWSSEISPMLDQMVTGNFPAKFADRVSELASGVADAAVKRDEHASKEAAGRKAMSLCFAVMGRTVRERIRAHVAGSVAPGSLEAWSELPPLIADAERALRSNVSPKFALSAFVSSAMETGVQGVRL